VAPGARHLGTRAMRFGRRHLSKGWLLCDRTRLALMPPPPRRRGGRILCYHSLGQKIFGVNDVSATRFRRHLELARGLGYRFVPASQIASGDSDPRTLAITFDDGLRSAADVAGPILASYQIPWSLFVVSNWVDQPGAWADENLLRWRDLEKLVAAGVEIGSHSASHPDFATIDPAQIADELSRSRSAIGRALGIEVKSFAIPFGQSKNWPAQALGAAREAGYSTIYAQAEETRPPETVPRTFVTRFDGDRIFNALLGGAFDRWEEWY
jgi:peptidoglycan/xylan/chitin deacetylase (PgdA/CDA1 family)